MAQISHRASQLTPSSQQEKWPGADANRARFQLDSPGLVHPYLPLYNSELAASCL